MTGADRSQGVLEALSAGRRPLLSVALLSTFLTIPILVFGVHSGADLPQHIQFADTFSSSIASGTLLPGWGAEENFGYGSLAVRFYPPVTGFLTGLVHLATGSWLWAIALVVLLFTFAGGVGSFLLAGEFTGRKGSLAAGLLFVVSPHHISDIFSTFFYAQYAGAAVLTFALLFTSRVCRHKKWRDVAMLSAAWALLVLTHLPLAIIASLALPVFAVFQMKRGQIAATIARLAAAAAAGLAASSFFWIKLIYELDLLRHTKYWKDEIFEFRHSFLLVPPNEIVFGLWYNNLILLTLAAFAGCAIYAVWKADTQLAVKRLRPPIALFIFAVFMTTPLSYPLWAFFPYLKEVQFPWRWLAVVNIAVCVIVGAGVSAVAGEARSRLSWKNPALWGLAAAVVLGGAFLNSLVSRYRKERIPAPEFHSWAETKTREIGFEYYWTVTTDPDVFSVREKVVASGREISIERWEPERRLFRVSEGPPVDARVATLFYPHWKAEVGGRPVNTRGSEDGAILVPLPAGERLIEVWFEEPTYVPTAEWVTAVSWIILFVFGGVAAVRRSSRERPPPLSTDP